ncbi:phospholipase D-like domain-containing protein [Oleiagrimonas sp. C23AA]|uniref:phospholipase D-like domain-containing protein n=1 Tax=Oleiagrimonas sp. C23AA TaxID=2719047 RepID=UPI001423FC64|nr:phospholipase D-like domain-containing protein [Oleiagrimonas sp. C23AA]NII10537.1 cardiolipin synthase B [Oleiagrimonas sp. C23AA]
MNAPSLSPSRRLAERAFSRAAGAPLIGGNAVQLMIDAQAHFDAWLAAIRSARSHVLLENYIVRDDDIGRSFRDALAERAAAGVRVCVTLDWLGCLGQSRRAFWQPLLHAGGEVRVYGAPQLARPLDFVSRDHRKLLVVDGVQGFISGVCISAKWLGEPERDVPPWRDTGLSLCGPAVAELQAAFADTWSTLGTPLDIDADAQPCSSSGDVSLRVIATQPRTAGVYRLDQLIASMARKTLWLTDAYFVGIAPYVQSLAAAARDGVDVRLLVPGASDIPPVAAMSRAGYRPLLQAGVRVFEWNGSMLHAKTAVADRQWARVGSSNLNLASWLGNCEIDVAIEDEDIAGQLTEQYQRDLENATEIVLAPRRRRRGTRVHSTEQRARPRPYRPGGSSSRAAAGALRLANTVGAALTRRRVLGRAETGPIAGGALALGVLGILALIWPAVLGWPLAVIFLWLSLSLSARWWRLRRIAHQEGELPGFEDEPSESSDEPRS